MASLILPLQFMGAVNYPDFDPATARKVFPLTFFFIGMVVTGLAALRFVNVPMYGYVMMCTSLCSRDSLRAFSDAAQCIEARYDVDRDAG